MTEWSCRKAIAALSSLLTNLQMDNERVRVDIVCNVQTYIGRSLSTFLPCGVYTSVFTLVTWERGAWQHLQCKLSEPLGMSFLP